MYMKKQILILTTAIALMLSTAISASAQGVTVTNGIKGGLTMSNLYIDEPDMEEEKSRYGFNAGFFSQMMFAETFGFQPELLFNTKGTRTRYTGILNQEIEFNLNYIDVPLLLVYRPVDMLEFHAGPYVGFLLRGDVAYSGILEGGERLNRDNFNLFDYGAAAGVALNFDVVKLGARYNFGLQNVAKNRAAEALIGDSKHAFLQIYLAWGFPRARY
jgi:hypothetical protein